MYYAVDRFEEELAVLEDDECVSRDVPRSQLPPGTKPGDVLWEENGAFSPAPEETDRRLKRILELQRRVFGQKKKEDEK